MNVMKSTVEFIKTIEDADIEGIKNYILNAENNTIFYPDEEGARKEGTLVEVILHYIDTSFDDIDFGDIYSIREVNKRIKAIPEILETIKNKGFELKCENFNFGEKLVEKGLMREDVIIIAEDTLFKKSSKTEKINLLTKIIEKNNSESILNMCVERINDFDKDYSVLLFVAIKENLFIDNFHCLLNNIPEVDINYRNKKYCDFSVFEFLCLHFGFKLWHKNNGYGTGNINTAYLNDIYIKNKAIISPLFLKEKHNELSTPVTCFIKEKIAAEEKKEMNKTISVSNDIASLKRRL